MTDTAGWGQGHLSVQPVDMRESISLKVGILPGTSGDPFLALGLSVPKCEMILVLESLDLKSKSTFSQL